MDEAQWQTLIAPCVEVMLEGFSLFRDWLVVEERREGLTLLRQIHWRSGEQKCIAFNDPTYTTWLAYNPEPETALLRYGYSSMTTPSTLYELNLDSGERVMLKQQEVDNFNPENYHSERLWVKARDGVEVPVSLIYRQDRFLQRIAKILIAVFDARVRGARQFEGVNPSAVHLRQHATIHRET